MPVLTPSGASLSFDLLPSPASNLLPGLAQALLGWNRPIALPLLRRLHSWIHRVVAFVAEFTAVTTFPVGSVVSFAGSSSSWLDPSLPWPSRPDQIHRHPFYSVACVATLTDAGACTVIGLPGGAPRQSDVERSEKALGLLLSFCAPYQSLTLERRPLQNMRPLLRVSRPQPS